MENNYTKTVFIAATDAELYEKLSPSLRESGFAVRGARSKYEVLELVKACNPAVVLLDFEMPGSKDILSLFKETRLNCTTPVIGLVNRIDLDFSLFAPVPSADDYVDKPFTPGKVLARINLQFYILSLQKENKELLERNRTLQQVSLTDELTGLYNRRFVLNGLCSEISHSSRYQEPVAFIMLDIDHFKKVNDTFGHITGDLLLKQVAAHIKVSIRESDVAIRFGGEEFLIVCTNTGLSGARALAERIRLDIKSNKLSINKKVIRITVSLGIISVIPESHTDPQAEIEKLIQCADIALYKAKTNGRNRIVVYNHPIKSSNPDNKINSGTSLGFENENSGKVND